MNNYSAKEILKKYKTQYSIWVYLNTTIALILLFTIPNDTLSLLPVLICLFANKIIRALLYNKHIQSILIKELDSFKYKAVIDEGKIFSKSLVETVLAEFYTGNYQTVVDICNWKLKDEKLAKYKFFYLICLSRIYFETENLEKLRSVYEEIEKEIEASNNPEKLLNKYPVFELFRLYLKSDFIGCKKFYENRLTNKRFISTKWQEIHTRFSYAIACYKSGDFENAKINFTYITENAPKLNFSKVAYKYLESMANEIPYTSESIEYLPDENYKNTLYNQTNKKVKALKIIGIFLIIIGIILSVVFNILEKNSYNSRAKAAVAELYDEFELLEVFNVRYNDETIAVMCICDTAEDNLITSSLYTYEGEDKLYLDTPVTDIEMDNTYYTRCFPSEYMMAFELFDNAEDIPKDTCQTAVIENDGKTYYFCIIKIQKHSITME